MIRFYTQRDQARHEAHVQATSRLTAENESLREQLERSREECRELQIQVAELYGSQLADIKGLYDRATGSNAFQTIDADENQRLPDTVLPMNPGPPRVRTDVERREALLRTESVFGKPVPISREDLENTQVEVAGPDRSVVND